MNKIESRKREGEEHRKKGSVEAGRGNSFRVDSVPEG